MPWPIEPPKKQPKTSLENAKKPDKIGLFRQNVAEEVGFEPTVPSSGTLDFESRPL